MLLIHPPVAKPCEPPAGVARLAAALQNRGYPCTVLDASLEGLLYLLDHPRPSADRWSLRAIRNTARNLALLRDPRTYRNIDRYKRAVSDLTRAGDVAAGDMGPVEPRKLSGPGISRPCAARTSSEPPKTRRETPSIPISASGSEDS